MTETTLRRVLVVVAGLVVGAGVAWLVGGREAPEAAEGPVPAALERVASSALTSVRIVGGEDTVALRKEDGGWRVNGHRADSAELAALRRALGEGASFELASRNAANHERMGVDSAAARRLVLETGEGELAELLLGDRGPGREGVYVRVPGTEPVHLVGGELGSLARGGPEAWRDRTLLALDTARVARIVVQRPDTTYRLRRTSDGWRVAGAAADSARVRGLLGRLTELAASGFAPDSATVEPADRSVLVLGRAGSDTLANLRLRRVGPDNRPRYRVTTRDRPGVFELSGPRADRILPPPAELTAPARRSEASSGS